MQESNIKLDLESKSLVENFRIKNEEIYKTVFHNSPVGIIHFDYQGRVLDCNDKLSEIIGPTRERLLKINLINDLLDTKMIEQIKRTLNFGNGYYEGNYRSIASGKDTPIIARYNAIYSSSGEIIGGVGLIEDNTVRVEIEKKMRENEYYLREAQKYSKIGHWKRDLITGELSRSDELLRIYDIDTELKDTPKELFYDIIHPDDVNDVIEAYSNALETKTEYNIIFRIILKDGKIKYVNEKGKNDYDNEGNPIRSMGIVQDITEIKKKELIQSALYQISIEASSDKSLGELYKSIHSIIKVLMPAENFYIALYDEETELLSFPYHVDEMDDTPSPRPLENGLSEYVLSQKRNMVITEELDRQLQKEGKVELSGEYTKIWVGIYLNFESNIKGVMVIQDYKNEEAYGSEDIEVLEYVSEQIIKAIDKKYTDEKLILSEQQLRKSNAAKDKFFSIISHDLKSPFQGIMGMAELLSEDFNLLEEEEKTESIYLLNKSLKNLYSLIEDLLEWSRIQTDKMEFNPVRVNLKEQFTKTMSLAKINAKSKNVKIKNNLDDNIFILADKYMIETVLRNLLVNAIKFSNDSGIIIISNVIDSDNVIISVKDFGIGMNKLRVNNLFKIDEHYTSIGTKGEKGTGLGLILCKELIEKNNGKIWVESEYGKGSTFSFSIPIAI